VRVTSKRGGSVSDKSESHYQADGQPDQEVKERPHQAHVGLGVYIELLAQ